MSGNGGGSSGGASAAYINNPSSFSGGGPGPGGAIGAQSIKKVRFNEYNAQNLTKMKQIRLEKEKEMKEMMLGKDGGGRRERVREKQATAVPASQYLSGQENPPQHTQSAG